MSEEKASHDEPDRGLVDTASDVFQIREANVAMAIFAVFTVIVCAINMQGWLSVEYHKGLDAITQKSGWSSSTKQQPAPSFRTFGRTKKVGSWSSAWTTVRWCRRTDMPSA